MYAAKYQLLLCIHYTTFIHCSKPWILVHNNVKVKRFLCPLFWQTSGSFSRATRTRQCGQVKQPTASAGVWQTRKIVRTSRLFSFIRIQFCAIWGLILYLYWNPISQIYHKRYSKVSFGHLFGNCWLLSYSRMSELILLYMNTHI